ncbi:MAG: hypothetical protein NTV46_13370 [Verrucomicrobia bacterium]|nr:hypothetical protein [Verrucomicrobiota bacterium]
MKVAIESVCETHPNRCDCPDALINYTAKFDEYGIIIHDGGMSVTAISYCPWCGAKLPESKRNQWFEALKQLGIDDPDDERIPDVYHNESWWHKAEQD